MTGPEARTLRRLARAAVLIAVIALIGTAVVGATHVNVNPLRERGEIVDIHNGVPVHFNGGVGQTGGRHRSADGYNYGLRWQCVEFVKRYYLDALGHRMPDTYGHARHFFDPALADGAVNVARGLVQHTNGGATRPEPDDLIVFAPSVTNPYGHVAIVSTTGVDGIEIVQQNPGPFGPSRRIHAVKHDGGTWTVAGSVLGWLRKPPDESLPP